MAAVLRALASFFAPNDTMLQTGCCASAAMEPARRRSAIRACIRAHILQPRWPAIQAFNPQLLIHAAATTTAGSGCLDNDFPPKKTSKSLIPFVTMKVGQASGLSVLFFANHQTGQN